MRQLPVEIDPPDHTECLDIVEPFFARSKMPEVIAGIEALIETLLAAAAHTSVSAHRLRGSSSAAC